MRAHIHHHIKQKKAEKLFSQTPVKKAIWIVILPSLLLALMFGLYSFVDYAFIQTFGPKNRPLFDNNTLTIKGDIYKYLDAGITKITQEQFNTRLDTYNSMSLHKIQTLTSSGLYAQVSFVIHPLIIFSNSIVFLVPVGAAYYYTECVQKKLEQTGRDLWATMFWSSVLMCLFSTLISYTTIWSGLITFLQARVIVNDSILQAYYDAFRNMAIEASKKYIYIYAAGTIIQGTSLLLSYFIRAEGYNSYVLGFGIVSNILNIILDYIFIEILKLGVIGGVSATLLGWTSTLIGYWAYVIHHERKRKTWLTFTYLFHFHRFDKELIMPALLLGSSSFLRSFGSAISYVIIGIFFTKTPYANPNKFLLYWSKGMPVLTLYLTSVFGINDGVRGYLSYNFDNHNFERVKRINRWTISITMIYSLIWFIFVAISANFIWVKVLHVPESEQEGAALFMRIIMLRVFAVAIGISSLSIFQSTNDVSHSILISLMDNFITFVFIVPIAFGFSIGIYNDTQSKDIANWFVVGFYIANSLIAGLIISLINIWYIRNKLQKIEFQKPTWSRKIEHDFFEKAYNNEINQVAKDASKT